MTSNKVIDPAEIFSRNYGGNEDYDYSSITCPGCNTNSVSLLNMNQISANGKLMLVKAAFHCIHKGCPVEAFEKNITLQVHEDYIPHYTIEITDADKVE